MRALPSQAQAEFTSHFLLSVSGRSPGAAFEEVPPSPAPRSAFLGLQAARPHTSSHALPGCTAVEEVLPLGTGPV